MKWYVIMSVLTLTLAGCNTNDVQRNKTSEESLKKKIVKTPIPEGWVSANFQMETRNYTVQFPRGSAIDEDSMGYVKIFLEPGGINHLKIQSKPEDIKTSAKSLIYTIDSSGFIIDGEGFTAIYIQRFNNDNAAKESAILKQVAQSIVVRD